MALSIDSCHSSLLHHFVTLTLTLNNAITETRPTLSLACVPRTYMPKASSRLQRCDDPRSLPPASDQGDRSHFQATKNLEACCPNMIFRHTKHHPCNIQHPTSHTPHPTTHVPHPTHRTPAQRALELEPKIALVRAFLQRALAVLTNINQCYRTLQHPVLVPACLPSYQMPKKRRNSSVVYFHSGGAGRDPSSHAQET